MRALAYIQSQPWMILPEYLDLMVEIASRERTPEDVAKGIKEARKKSDERASSPAALAIKQGEPLGDNKRVRVRDGVAIVSVIGPIVRYADFFSSISGATSTERMAQDFGQAMNAHGVNSILLFIDSPGGEAFGIAEMAGIINSSEKPVVAYIGGYGASAAYYLAAAADEVVIDSASMLGSIGTVMEATDYSRAYEQRGIKKHQYVSAQSPKKRPRMGTESGDAQMQEIVDDMAQVFVEDVARFRGVTVDRVLSDFGQGGTMIGKKAVTAGMADRIGSFEQVLSELSSGSYSKKKRPRMAASSEATNPQSEVNTMSNQEKPSIWARIFGSAQLSDEDKSEIAKAAGIGAGSPPAAPPPQQPTAAPPASAQDQTRIEALQRQLETERGARFRSEANAFADLVTGPTQRKALPAERDSIITAYMTAAEDDITSPRQIAYSARGEARTGSRVDALKASYDARGSHSLTAEFVPFDASSMSALDTNANNTAEVIADARKQGEQYAASVNRKAN